MGLGLDVGSGVSDEEVEWREIRLCYAQDRVSRLRRLSECPHVGAPVSEL